MSTESQSTQMDKSERPAPVAQKGTLSVGESVPFYYKLIDLITLSPTDESVLKNPKKIVEELLSFAESVGCSPSRRAVFGHLLLNHAESASTIKAHTGLPEPSLYRAIAELVELGYIIWAIPTKINWKRKGYSSGIVSLPTATPEDLIAAREREITRVKPQVKMVQKVYQLILDEYEGRDEVNRAQVIQRIKPAFNGFAIKDILTWVDDALELVERNKKLKVWR